VAATVGSGLLFGEERLPFSPVGSLTFNLSARPAASLEGPVAAEARPFPEGSRRRRGPSAYTDAFPHGAPNQLGYVRACGCSAHLLESPQGRLGTVGSTFLQRNIRLWR
jgi:hypothetical protein